MLLAGLPVLADTATDSIIADFDSLVRIIEDTHPDPYTNFGGRVFFHKNASDLRNKILTDSAPTVHSLYEKSSEFISRLKDGHSFINPPQYESTATGSDSLLLIKFMYAADSLIVNAIDSIDGHLLGSRLTAINGIPIDRIADIIARLHPCENTAGRYNHLADFFKSPDFYRRLTDKKDDSITMSIITPDGDSIAYRPRVIHFSQFGEMPKARIHVSDRFPTRQMEYRITGNAMVFRLATVQSRENFEYQYRNGWDFYPQLQYYYRMAAAEMPADTLEAITTLPSMSETFMNMLTRMKARSIKNLIIDLRGNGGGWTPVIYPTLYMMYGDCFLCTDMSNKFYRRISDLYLKKLCTTIDDFNSMNGTRLRTGDYIMPLDETDTRSIEQKREDFFKQAFCSDSVKECLRALNGRPLYRPDRVYVITDAGTFSAAFHYAYYLSRMGATVAGETSSQAPNCYMEVTPFVLPATGLTGSVSNSMQIFLPANDPRATEFTPDIRLRYDDYRRHGFDYHSILIHLLQNLQ